jgi:hypothetical protein
MVTMTPLIVENETQHMILGEDRGSVYFVCETQPLTALRTFGRPKACPFCGVLYPTNRSLARA